MSLATDLGTRFKAELTSQSVSTISGALLIYGLARLLEPNDYGLLFLAISAFSIASIFSKLGLSKSAARYITDYRERNPGQLPYIIKVAFIFNSITIAIVAFVFLTGHEFIAVWIGEPKLAPLLALGVFFITFETLTKFTRRIAQGFEDIYLAAIILILDRGGRLFFAIGLILLGYNIIGALIGYIVASAIASLFGLIAIYYKFYTTIPPADAIEEGLTRRILEYNVPLTITGLSGKVDKELDTILVGLFLNPISVSYYVLGKQIISFVQMPATALGFSISPTYGKQKASGELFIAAKMFERSFIYTLLLYVPAAVGILLIAEPTVEIIFGESYTGAVPVLQVFSIFVVLSSITNITDYPLDFLGRAKSRAIAKGIASISNVVLNILLIPTVGVVGAAIATVITHSFYVLVKIFIISSELPLDINRVVPELTKIAFVSISMGVPIWAFSHQITGIFTLTFIVLLGIIIWASLSILTGLIDRKEFRVTLDL
ncbi:flippase [Halovivax gelatinilyticus]|uniref:flippase n=1 Tax=Halovivax gelatinilyticus TaxID=2961597 RepID=UPI0020CA3AD9|nr:flippase [Halovivax gelatinilyticus]